MSHFSRSNQSYANASQHYQSSAIKPWSLIPEIVMVVAMAWFSFDLAFRFGGYQESYWMIDVDMVALIALIVGVGILAVRYNLQSVEHRANEHQPIQTAQYRVSDGGMNLLAHHSKPNTQRVKEPSAFDGGTFPGWM